MISSIAGPPLRGIPPVKLGCGYSSGLLLGHFDGSFSVLRENRVLAQVQNPTQEIEYMRVLDEVAFVSFSNGVLAQYSLPTGILQQTVQLGGAIQGMFAQQDCLVVWGVQSQVSFINRATLDIEKTLYFDSKPVRVHFDKQLAVVLRSGYLHWIVDRTIGQPLVFPINSGTAVDLIDAACIDRGKWVCIQRERWSIVTLVDNQFQVELSSPGPGFFNKLLLLQNTASFAAQCNEGELLIVESNNIQILKPQWPTYTLRSIIWDHEPLAILKCGSVYNGIESQGQGWEWQLAEDPAKLNSTAEWIMCHEHVATECQVGVLDGCEFVPLFTADHKITSIAVGGGTKLYLGLCTGSVLVLEDNTLKSTLEVLAAPIVQIKAVSGCLICWSTFTVGLVTDELPVVIPVEDAVQNVDLVNGHILCVKTTTQELVWDLTTLEPSHCEHVFGELSAIKVNSPFNSRADFTSAPRIGLVCTDSIESITLFDPNQPGFSAAKFTILCNEGYSLHTADQELRKLGVSAEDFEQFVLLVDQRSEKLRSTATRLMQSLTDKNRMEALLSTSGIRSSLLLSSVFPNVPVEAQLKQRTRDLLGASLTERLVALKILGSHPDLLPFPFNPLRELQITTAARRFVKRAATVDLALVSKAVCTEIEIGEPKNFVPCVEFAGWILEEPEFDLTASSVFALVDSVAQTMHRMPDGRAAVRKVLQTVLTRFPENAVFFKPRQLLFVQSPAAGRGLYGSVWHLGSGNRLNLAVPPTPCAIPGFTNDGKALVSARYEWRFPSALATFFSGDHAIQPKQL